MSENSENLPALHYANLIRHYVDICNEALTLNAGRFPFKQILGAAKTSGYNKPTEVHVFHDFNCEKYIFRLNENGIQVEPCNACDNRNGIRTWNVHKEYLDDVTREPATYIQNPAKLNWEWLCG